MEEKKIEPKDKEAPTKIVKIGIIGFGQRLQFIYKSIRSETKNVVLHGIFDPNKDM